MKNKNKRILLIFCLIWLLPTITAAIYRPIGIVKTLVQNQLATVFSSTYDISTPAGSDSPSEADDRMRETKAAVQERLAVEHRFALTGTEVSAADTGEHTDITTDSIVNAGAMTASGTITLGAGADLVGSATSDITFNTNKFTVAGDTGNTSIAGTLDVTGAFESTGIATLADASVTKTTAAPGADAQIANKKYVDDQIAAIGSLFGTWIDSISITSGVASSAVATDGILLVHVDTAAGYTRCQLFSGPNGTEAKGNFFTGSQVFDEQYVVPVKKGEKYKVTVPDGAPTITGYFIPIGN